MPITPDEYSYPFDPTGTAPSNKVVGEVHVITQQNHRDYSFVIPSFAPFFAEGVSILFTDANGNAANLVEGTDYYFGHHFLAASRSISKQVYGSISFINKEFKGTMALGYHTLGGKWTYDQNYLNQLMTNIISNPRSSSWDSIAELPALFPVIDHEWNLIDMIGMSHVVAGLYGIETAIRDPEGTGTGGGSGSDLMNHILDRVNPHAVTKLQVGLGNVQNFALAEQLEAEEGIVNNKYVSPLLVKQAIAKLALEPLTTHTTRVDNPHSTTKAQTGLGLVENYAIATQAEAEEGVVSNKYMTPLQAKQAIAKLALEPLTTHTTRVDNPHAVTKAQVGLGSVQNYAIATQLEAEAGAAINCYMTPLQVKQAIAKLALEPLSAHTDRIDNPHNTTKAQVGLGNVENYPIATKIEAEDGTSNNVYMTALRVKEALSQLLSGNIDVHTQDYANPHQTTKAQVGLGSVDNYATATVQEATTGTSNNTFMTPSLTVALLNSHVSDEVINHAERTDNPHSVTAAQVGAYTTQAMNLLLADKLDKTASAANSLKLENLTVAQLTAQILLGKAASSADADMFDGKTYAQVTTDILSSTIANSLKLEDKSLAEVLTLAYDQGTANAAALGGFTLSQIYQAIPNFANVARQTVNIAVPTIAGAVNVWTHLFSMTNSVLTDAQILVAGGDAVADPGSYLYLVKANPRTGEVSATNLLGGTSAVVFGFIVETSGLDSVINVWMKSNPKRSQVSLTELNDGLAQYPITDLVDYQLTGVMVAANVTTIEPPTIGYVVETNVFAEHDHHVANTDNPHDVTKAQLGLGNVENFSIASKDDVLSSMTNFADIFDTWLRYSHNGAIQPSNPSELNAWVYNPVTDKINCTLNSSTQIGFVSPTEYSDYDFQVELSSTSGDDDRIGIVIGFEVIGGVEYTLTAARQFDSVTGNSFVVTYNIGLAGGKVIGVNDGGLTPNIYHTGSGGTGWSTIHPRLRAVRQGNIITVYTTDVNGVEWLDSKKIVIDLSADVDLQKFMTSSSIGFYSQSQPNATWDLITTPWARNDVNMTPLRTREAIEALAIEPLSDRIDVTDANLSTMVTELTTLFAGLTV